MTSFLDSFIDWSSFHLSQNDEATSYLYSRGCSPDQIVRHRLGYIPYAYEPDDSTDLLHDEEKCLKKPCNVCKFKHWSTKKKTRESSVNLYGDRIVGSIVLPITTYSGSVVGFQTRSLKEKRYDSFLLSRRDLGYFFGLGPNVDRIWTSGVCWVVEGPFDQLVVENVFSVPAVAITTSVPSTSQFRFLRRFCHTVYIYMDIDGAGRKGTRRMVNQLGSEINIVDVNLKRFSSKKDAGDLWLSLGAEKMRSLVHKAIGE